MSEPQQIINVGQVANDGTGESLRDAFNAVNNNFANVWAAGPVNSQVVISNNRVSTNETNLDLILAGNGVGNVTVASTTVPSLDAVYDLGRANRRFDEVHAVYYYGNGAYLTGINANGTGGGNVYFSQGAPNNPAIGDIWIESDTGVQYLYFNDNTSNQWAEMEAYQSFSYSAGGNYGDSNVATFLAAYGSNTVSTTGNITSSNLSVTGNVTGNTAGFAVGYRDIPQVSFSANATAALTDAGKHYYSTTAGNLALTLPDNSNVALPTGATLTVVVNAAGNVLVNQGTGVSLYMAGSSTTGNRVVGAYGLASVMKVAANVWVISGTGVY